MTVSTMFFKKSFGNKNTQCNCHFERYLHADLRIWRWLVRAPLHAISLGEIRLMGGFCS